jgi:hypothetical protein
MLNQSLMVFFLFGLWGAFKRVIRDRDPRWFYVSLFYLFSSVPASMVNEAVPNALRFLFI